jgi:hypothetical protein
MSNSWGHTGYLFSANPSARGNNTGHFRIGFSDAEVSNIRFNWCFIEANSFGNFQFEDLKKRE